jgi:hypothetical protein
MTTDFKRRIEEARAIGGTPAAAGMAARDIVGRMVGDVGSAFGAVKRYTLDPAANALRTVVTGDPTPIPGTAGARPPAPTTPAAPAPTTPSALRTPQAGDRNAFKRADDASVGQFQNSRMAGMGWSSRDVQGAPGIQRFDRAGQSPLYTNDVGNTADWVGGGMRPGVNTMPASSFGAVRGGGVDRAAAMDNESFMSGQTLSRPGSFGGIRSGSGNMSALDQFNQAYDARRDAERRRLRPGEVLARDRDYASALGSFLGLEGVGQKEAGATARSQMGEQGADRRAQLSDRGADRREQVASQTALARELMSGEFGNRRQELANTGALNVATAQGDIRQQMSGLSELYKAMYNPDTPEEMRLEIEQEILRKLNGPRGYEDGGLVEDPYDSAIGYAQGGMVGGAGYGQTPDAQAVLPEINEYREYVMGTKSLGVPAVPFEQFLTMRTGAKQAASAQQQPQPVSFADGGLVHPRRAYVESLPRQAAPDWRPAAPQERYSAPEAFPERPAGSSADRAPLGGGMVNNARSALMQLRNRPMAFANGGEIPDPRDVSGRMVVDADPNAPTDSIPAMVDETMPAKLDSGEFVIPTDVVQFFGTDKLNKMIAQARQGQ